MKTIKPAGFKKLALGVMLACGVNNAHAVILIPNASDVFLSVWDPTSQSSFTADLGVDLTTFATTYGAANHSWTLDSVFSGWTGAGGIANGNPLTYNIAAVNQTASKSDTLNGLLLSYNSFNGANWVQGGTNASNLLLSQNAVKARINDLNLNTGLPGDSTELVTNTSYADYFVSTNHPWGENEATGKNLSTTVGGGGVNQLFVEYIHSPGGTVTTTTQVAVTNLTGYFSLDVATSTLRWTSTAVTAVPVPGVAWLFLSGVMTLLGLQKRKSALAA